MLSPNALGHNSASPPGQESTANGPKRKRKIYSCYECRRRKLRCDRGYPSCSRCQKAGQTDSCYYDAPPPAPTPSEPTVASAAVPRTPIAASVPRSTTLDNHRPHIAGRLSNLEADQNNGTWQLLSARAASVYQYEHQRPAVKADNEEPPFPGRTHDSIRKVIFRGENFRTQYFGGSNPASLIGHVRQPSCFF